MSDQNLTTCGARAISESGEGILRLAPTWVPRSFLMPGGRLQGCRVKTSTPSVPTAAESTSLWFLLHDRGGQRGGTRRRGSELRRAWH